MAKYKNLLNDAQGKISKFKKEMAEVKEQSKRAQEPQTFINSNLQDKLKQLEQDLHKNATERAKVAIEKLSDANSKTQELNNKSNLLTNEKLLHNDRAARMINRGSLDDAIEAYKRLCKNLSENDKKYRYLYDEEIKERTLFEDPNMMHRVDGAIDTFRSDDEKEAIRAVAESEILFEYHKTADGLINEQLRELKETGDCTNYEWDSVYSDMQQRAEKRSQSDPEVKDNVARGTDTLENNPYHEESQ